MSDFSKGGYEYVNVISGKDLYDSFLKDWGDKYANKIVNALANSYDYGPLIEGAVKTTKEYSDRVFLPLLNYDFDRTSDSWGTLLTILLTNYNYRLPPEILSKLGKDDLKALKKYLGVYEKLVEEREGDRYAEDSYDLINESYKYLKNNLRK